MEMLQELLNTILEEDSEAGIVRLQEKADAVKSPVLREVLDDIAHILCVLLQSSRVAHAGCVDNADAYGRAIQSIGEAVVL